MVFITCYTYFNDALPFYVCFSGFIFRTVAYRVDGKLGMKEDLGPTTSFAITVFVLVGMLLVFGLGGGCGVFFQKFNTNI